MSSAYHDAGEDYGGGDGMGVYDEVDTAEVREVDRSSRNDIWRMVSWKGKYDLADMKHLWERKPPSAGNTPEADEE